MILPSFIFKTLSSEPSFFIDKKVEILNFLKENKNNWYTLEDLSGGISIPQCAGIMTSLVKEDWVEWKRNNGEKYYSWKERD